MVLFVSMIVGGVLLAAREVLWLRRNLPRGGVDRMFRGRLLIVGLVLLVGGVLGVINESVRLSDDGETVSISVVNPCEVDVEVDFDLTASGVRRAVAIATGTTAVSIPELSRVFVVAPSGERFPIDRLDGLGAVLIPESLCRRLAVGAVG